MLMSRAARVAKITAPPIRPTTFAPTVKSPTPMTVPVVMVIDSRSPRHRRRAGDGVFSRISLASFPKTAVFLSVCGKRGFGDRYENRSYLRAGRRRSALWFEQRNAGLTGVRWGTDGNKGDRRGGTAHRQIYPCRATGASSKQRPVHYGSRFHWQGIRRGDFCGKAKKCRRQIDAGIGFINMKNRIIDSNARKADGPAAAHGPSSLAFR